MQNPEKGPKVSPYFPNKIFLASLIGFEKKSPPPFFRPLSIVPTRYRWPVNTVAKWIYLWSERCRLSQQRSPQHSTPTEVYSKYHGCWPVNIEEEEAAWISVDGCRWTTTSCVLVFIEMNNDNHFLAPFCPSRFLIRLTPQLPHPGLKW